VCVSICRCWCVRWPCCSASSAACLRVCGVLPRPVPLCALPCPALPGAGSEVAPSMDRRGRERIGGPLSGRPLLLAGGGQEVAPTAALPWGRSSRALTVGEQADGTC